MIFVYFYFISFTSGGNKKTIVQTTNYKQKWLIVHSRSHGQQWWPQATKIFKSNKLFLSTLIGRTDAVQRKRIKAWCLFSERGAIIAILPPSSTTIILKLPSTGYRQSFTLTSHWDICNFAWFPSLKINSFLGTSCKLRPCGLSPRAQ